VIIYVVVVGGGGGGAVGPVVVVVVVESNAYAYVVIGHRVVRFFVGFRNLTV